jgi:CRISPR-associated protein Cas1
MSWRVICVSQTAHLSVRLSNLVVRQEEEITVPLEDVGVVILESRAVTVSAALLDALIQHKVALFVCDERHLPSGQLLGYQQHSRQSKVIQSQLNLSLPFKKRLWQAVVMQKIRNQGEVYRLIKGRQEEQFNALVRSVRSGDSLNREATAARLYFSELLPSGVTRGSDHPVNDALNYGYAIIRGALARSLASYGFLCSYGIHHANELDNFALADDFMEPFRPFVDAVVFGKMSGHEGSLSKEMRGTLVAVLTGRACVDGKENTVLRAAEVCAQSLVTAISENDPEALRLPALV